MIPVNDMIAQADMIPCAMCADQPCDQARTEADHPAIIKMDTGLDTNRFGCVFCTAKSESSGEEGGMTHDDYQDAEWK